MGLRFRKTIGILPGVRVNLSKTGVSASLGGKGATVNVGTKGATGTVGVPGSGLSYRQPLRKLGWGLVLLLAVAAAGFYYLRREVAKPARHVATTSMVSSPAGGNAVVAAAGANCRETPGRAGKVAVKLGQGDSVEVVERAGAWTRVKAVGSECWVSNRTIRQG